MQTFLKTPKYFKIVLFLQPGGGQVKIAVRKLEWKAVARTNANNEKYEVFMQLFPSVCAAVTKSC